MSFLFSCTLLRASSQHFTGK